jgi:uncharacterized membrane protein
VAINLDYWSWKGDVIPVSNYIGWFVVSFFIQLGYRKTNFKKQNAISTYLLFHLLVFFVILNFIT